MISKFVDFFNNLNKAASGFKKLCMLIYNKIKELRVGYATDKAKDSKDTSDIEDLINK